MVKISQLEEAWWLGRFGHTEVGQKWGGPKVGAGLYLASSKELIYSSYHSPSSQNGSSKVGPDTLFRIHSISKVMAVYAILAKLGDKYWEEPVSKYVPELSGKPRDPIRDVNWSDVTLGALAGQSGGISRDCKRPGTESRAFFVNDCFADALADGSTAFRTLPGLRPLKDSEVVKCGSAGQNACSRKGKLRTR